MQELQKSPNGYRVTKIGEIPKEWELKSIGDLQNEKAILEVQDGNHGELHPKQRDFVKDGVPFITANCIVNNQISFERCQYLDEEWLRKLRIGFAKANDVLLTHKGSLGMCAIVPDGIGTIILSPQTTYYRLSDSLSKEFLYYIFQSSFFQKQLFQFGKQSTRDYVGITIQRKLVIPFIPVGEQQKIASILSNVDELIKKTDEIIKQTQRLKEGLMQRLLSKGVRHIKFRTVKSIFAKHEDIPEEWEHVTLGDLVQGKAGIKIGPFGSSLKKHELLDSGEVKTLWIENIVNNKLSWDYKRYITREKYEELKSFAVKPGDVVVTMMGTVGRAAVIPEDIGTTIISSHLLKISLNQEKCLPEYLYYYLLLLLRIC